MNLAGSPHGRSLTGQCKPGVNHFGGEINGRKTGR